MKEKLLIVGAGHLVKEVVDFVKCYDLFEIVGFTVDEQYIKEKTYLGLPVYPIDSIESFIDKDEVKVFIAISWYHKLCKTREEKFNLLKGKGFNFANLISPNAIIHAKSIGEGNWILDQVYIGYQCDIGSNNVFIHKSSVAHYSIIGNHNFVGAHSNLLGHVTIGDRCFVGSSSVVFNQTKIGNKCVIGAGSIVKKNLKDYSVTIAQKCSVVHMNEEAVELMINAG